MKKSAENIFAFRPCCCCKRQASNNNKKNDALRPGKKRNPTLFYGQTDLPSRVGRSGDFFFFFSHLWFKKTTPKHQNFEKTDIFCSKNFGKIFRLIFKKFQPKFSDLGTKTADFTRFWKNKKQIFCQKENLDRSRP